jgi:hypothetical protein
MVDITLFEVHLDDSSLTANAPFSRGRKEVEAGDGELPAKSSSSSSKGKLVAALLGLVFLAAVAFVARKKGGGGDEEVEGELEVSGVKA